MRSPRRWFRRMREERRIRPRAAEVAALLRQEVDQRLDLVPGQAKGGADAIFYAERAGERVGVLRLNNPYKRRVDQRSGLLPRISLTPRERLDREWDIYGRLSAIGLAPEPLWRTQDAMMCRYVRFPRVALTLIADRSRFWPLIELTAASVRRMHDAGVTHLDLNLGNVLASEAADELRFIDFEYAPSEWITPAQQRAYDYVRLVTNSLKRRRGLAQVRSEPARLVPLLERCVDDAAREADLSFAFPLCGRLVREPVVCETLRQVFPNLKAA